MSIESNGHHQPPTPAVVPDPTFPVPGTPEWLTMNNRRWDLSDKKVAGTLTSEERGELQWLQEQTSFAVEAAFPRPPVNMALLKEIEQRLLRQTVNE